MARHPGDADPPLLTVPQIFFDDVYSGDEDPYGYTTEWYERRKYAITLASLPRERYRHALEPGCSIGELTQLLAPRCDRILAVDSTAIAVSQARENLAGCPHAEVRQARLPRELPAGRFDLVVASEILYYFSIDDLGSVLDGLLDRLGPGGDLVAVHHRTPDRPYGYDGFNVHGVLTGRAGLDAVAHHDDEEFVLDVLRRR